jgi:antitoxin component YwqK of YwqJK toxin-antitoxin module
MVVAPPGLMRGTATLVCAAALTSTLATAAPAKPVLESYVVTGNCRDGRPHGAYELRTANGQLRVAGAFNQGKRIGSFLFWSSSGARLALLPFDDDALTGTVALWYFPASAKGEPQPKLEAAYANGVLSGTARSWHPDGHPRAEFRYEHGELAEARAWGARGKPVPDADARAMAAKDRVADETYYNALETVVRDHPPTCDANGRQP